MEINETQLVEIITTSIASVVKPLHEEVTTLKANSTVQPKTSPIGKCSTEPLKN